MGLRSDSVSAALVAAGAVGRRGVAAGVAGQFDVGHRRHVARRCGVRRSSPIPGTDARHEGSRSRVISLRWHYPAASSRRRHPKVVRFNASALGSAISAPHPGAPRDGRTARHSQPHVAMRFGVKPRPVSAGSVLTSCGLVNHPHCLSTKEAMGHLGAVQPQPHPSSGRSDGKPALWPPCARRAQRLDLVSVSGKINRFYGFAWGLQCRYGSTRALSTRIIIDAEGRLLFGRPLECPGRPTWGVTSTN